MATSKKQPLNLLALAKSPSILIPYLDNCISLAGCGMIESMLEPYMKTYTDASQTDVGNTFLVMGAIYMVITPLTGYVSITHTSDISKKRFHEVFDLFIKTGRKFKF
jgi:predicted MFS family arabinose efflux permease